MKKNYTTPLIQSFQINSASVIAVSGEIDPWSAKGTQYDVNPFTED